jgi:hypothetical protein
VAARSGVIPARWPKQPLLAPAVPDNRGVKLTMARLWALLIVAGVTLVASGCGSAQSAGKVARPQALELKWRENCGTRADPIPIGTRSIVVDKGAWRVALSFRNRTRVTLLISRPHVQGGTWFGLEPFRTASWREVLARAAEGAPVSPRTLAEHFSPTLPRLLPPGRGWTGEFSGHAALPAGAPIRVVLGKFVGMGKRTPSDIFRGFLCVSKRVVRLR